MFICSGGGGKGFFEDGFEEVGGVGARVRHLQRQQPAAPQQRFHSRHDRRLLRQRRERDGFIEKIISRDIVHRSGFPHAQIVEERF